jgi:hypothetical protein
MAVTAGVVAAAAEADLAAAVVGVLAHDGVTCGTTPEALDAASVAIILCAPASVFPLESVAAIERAFKRGAHLVPILVDVAAPPDSIAHFIAGLRPLFASRAEFPAAISALRRAISSPVPSRRPAITEHRPRTPEHRPIALNLWSRLVRGTSPVFVAIISVKLFSDVSTASSLLRRSNSVAFDAWFATVNRLGFWHSALWAMSVIAFCGWVRTATRLLVLAHRERTVLSGRRLWGAYLIGLLYPPSAIARISRLWTSVTQPPGAAVAPWRVVVATIWWLSFETILLSQLLWFGLVGRDLYDMLSASVPVADGTQFHAVVLMAVSDASFLITSILSAIIAAETSANGQPRKLSQPFRSSSRPLTILVAASPLERTRVDALASRLRSGGIRAYAADQSSRRHLESFDALIVFGHARSMLTQSDVDLVAEALTTGRVPCFPVFWGSDGPPRQMQELLGPLHWHPVTEDLESVHSLLRALLRHPPRAAVPVQPAALLLGTVEQQRSVAPHITYVALAIGCAYGFVSLCRSLAGFDLLAVALAVARDPTVLQDGSGLFPALAADLAARCRSLLPAVTGIVGASWALTRVGTRLFPSRDRSRRIVEGLALILAVVLIYPAEKAASVVLTFSALLTVGTAIALFTVLRAAKRGVRRIRPLEDDIDEPRRASVETADWLVVSGVTIAAGVLAVLEIAILGVLSLLLQNVVAHPGDPDLAAKAATVAGSAATISLLAVQIPFVGIWWLWLTRVSRIRARSGGSILSRSRKAFAMIPLIGHVGLPDLVGELTHHRYREGSLFSGAIDLAACGSAFCLTMAQICVLPFVGSGDMFFKGRMLLLSTLAFFLASVSSVALFWMVVCCHRSPLRTPSSAGESRRQQPSGAATSAT